MTAAHLSTQVPPPAARVNWTMVGVIVAVLVHAGAAVAFAAALDRRVAAIEQQLPAGAIARLDERTLLIQRSIERLEPRR